MSEPEVEMTRPTTSTRDPGELRRRLRDWLALQVKDPEISSFEAPDTNGMSSETVLFDATWDDDGRRVAQRCVARLAPPPDAAPVFPVYDMEKQFRAIGIVRERTDVPVPRTLWLENDASHLGTPFFVMERIDGEVPPDILPYTFGESWLFHGSPEEQARLQRSSVEVLVKLHAVPLAPEERALLELDRPGDTPLRRHVADQRAYYEWTAADGVRSPLIEQAFDWLEEHWPQDEGETVLSWGDSRIGNILYRDFEPVAVLDWEMAAVGPREIDLGWMIFLHRFFQDLTIAVGLPGMPQFMRRDDVAATYAELSGHEPRNLDFFITYAALRHAIVMFRITRRSVFFGEAEMPDDPDDAITHRGSLEAMLLGVYWQHV